MPSILVEFDSATCEQLHAQAHRAGISVSELVARIVERERAEDVGIDDDVRHATAEVIQQYRPVLHRLAQ
jgi:hypothetical protein